MGAEKVNATRRWRFQFTGSLLESSLYMERDADRELHERLMRGDYCHILAPRQIGKSSLGVRTMKRLASAGIKCVWIDLTAIGNASSPEEWYFGLAEELSRGLGLEDPLPFWRSNTSPPAHRASEYLRRALAKELVDGRVVVFFDEIEAVRLAQFPMDDFFMSIRALYEERSRDADSRRLTFCLIGVTTPNDLVKDKLITPFNVSHPIRLEDFTRAELEPLAAGLEHLGADTSALLDSIHEWTDGHPYMTMRLCASLNETGILRGTEEQAVAAAVGSTFLAHPFEDPNLNYAARRFDDPSYERRDASLTDKLVLFSRLIGDGHASAEVESAVQYELRLAGMVKDKEVDGKRELRVRNRIFARVFDREWLRTKGNRRFLAEAVWKWLDADRDPSYLLRGEGLQKALETTRSMVLPDQEAEFLAESQRAQRADLERQRAYVEKATRTLRRAAFVFGAVAVAGAVGSIVLSRQSAHVAAELKDLDSKKAELEIKIDDANKELASKKNYIAQVEGERDAEKKSHAADLLRDEGRLASVQRQAADSGKAARDCEENVRALQQSRDELGKIIRQNEDALAACRRGNGQPLRP